MKRSKFSETQIVSILKEGEAGRAVAEICREHGISNATYFQWKSKYGGIEESDLRSPNTVFHISEIQLHYCSSVKIAN